MHDEEGGGKMMVQCLRKRVGEDGGCGKSRGKACGGKGGQGWGAKKEA